MHILFKIYFFTYYMKKRLLLLIIFIIFLVSFTTFLLILNYLDPFEYRLLALISIIFTFILSVSSFFTIIFYFFKKIYYRWRVYIFHVLTSFRQWFFISLLALSIIFFNILQAPLLLTSFLLFLIFAFLELFIQNLENN